MTETDYAATWREWLDSQLKARGWRQADLVHNSGGHIKRDRASKWLSGNERPSYRLAIVVANTLDVAHEKALQAAGYSETAEALANEAMELGREYGARMRRLGEEKAQNAPSLRLVSSADLLAELGRRLANVEPNVAGPEDDQSDYVRVARERSRDRGEDLQ